MEKKEREQLKGRLLKMVVNEPRLESMPPMTMAEVMVNSMSKPNLEPLLDFISQELDKAREEVQFTRKQLEVLDGLMERIATASSGEILWPNERTVWGKIDTLLNSKDKNNE